MNIGDHRMNETLSRTSRILCSTFVIALIASLLGSAQVALAEEGGGWIEYGQTMQGVIDDNDYIHYWHFNGNAGDVVTAIASAPSAAGNLDTYIDFWYRGTEWQWLTFDDNSAGGDLGSDAGLYSYSLPYSGEYVVAVSRYGQEDGTTSGVYFLYLDMGGAGSGSGSSSSSGSYQGSEEVPYDYFEEGDCPLGYCLTSGSFSWPTAQASFCIASSYGDDYQGMNLWGDNTIQDFASNAARYWMANSGFNLYQHSECGSDTNIVIGWTSGLQGNPLGSTYVGWYESNQQVLIGMNFGSGGVVTDEYGATLFHWNPWSGDGRGYDGSLVLTHELGHAIGLGHDVETGMLMYPNATPGATYSDSYSLGQDSLNELLVKYPSLTVGGVNQYEKVGFSGAYLTSENGYQDSVWVPLPDGVGSRLHDLRASCTVVGYLPDTDDDVAFSCGWDINNTSSGSVPFYLDTYYSDHSTVIAYAFLWDANVYPVLEGFAFTMNADTIWFTDLYGNQFQYSLPFTYRVNTPLLGNAAPVVNIYRYETNTEDEMGWTVIDNMDASFTFATTYPSDWEDSYVQGFLHVMGWSGSGTPRTNTFGVDARADWNYYQLCGDNSLNRMDTGLDIWETNASAFSSLSVYAPWDKDFGAYSLARAESGHGGMTNLDVEYMTEDGNSNSCAIFQNMLFQISP